MQLLNLDLARTAVTDATGMALAEGIAQTLESGAAVDTDFTVVNGKPVAAEPITLAWPYRLALSPGLIVLSPGLIACIRVS